MARPKERLSDQKAGRWGRVVSEIECYLDWVDPGKMQKAAEGLAKKFRRNWSGSQLIEGNPRNSKRKKERERERE